MKKEIEDLVIAKGFYNKPEDIPKKLLFAFIELGEASDAWKKKVYLKRKSLRNS